MKLLFFLLQVVAVNAWAHPILDGAPESPLSPHKGDGSFGAEITYQLSNDFYDSSGHLKDSSDPAFPDGAKENYNDVLLNFATIYGLTDALALWLDFPLVYRNETAAFDTHDWGLGDVHAGALVRFYKTPDHALELGMNLSGRFPSGDTDIAFSQASAGKKIELPLGAGTTDLTPEFLLKWHLPAKMSAEASLAYTFRFAARVEYLQSPLILQSSADLSQTAALPVGNLVIDWGDEVNLGARWAWKVMERMAVAINPKYFYRRSTQIHTFNFTVNGTTFDSSNVLVASNTAHLFRVDPSFLFDLTPHLSLLAKVGIPIWGKNYPTFPFVESLVGYPVEIGVRYAF